MKWRESIFAKWLAFSLMTVFFAVAVLTAAVMTYAMLNKQVYEASYWDTDNYMFSIQSQLTALESDDDRYVQISSQTVNGLSFFDWLATEPYTYKRWYSPESNLMWLILDESHQIIATNLPSGDAAADVLRARAQGNEREHLTVNNHRIMAGVDAELPMADAYQRNCRFFNFLKQWLYPLTAICGVALLLALILLAFLIAVCGHRRGVPGITLLPLDRLWIELYFAWDGLLAVATTALWLYRNTSLLLKALVSVVLLASLVVTFFSLVRRVKACRLYRTSLLYALARGFSTVSRHFPLTLSLCAIAAGWSAVQIFLLYRVLRFQSLGALLLLAVGHFLVIAVCLLVGIQYQQIDRASDRMANGQLGTVIHENSVPFFAHLARNLNNTGQTLDLALQQRMQSERFKTDLITNVSHDIKTPLTSIISYVELLKNTPPDDPHTHEYLEVLDSKSRRLAQLVNDLVEASKVTTGSVSVTMEQLNLGELIKQVGGETEYRLAERHLSLVFSLPETPVMAYADGRHMWRVLDNLFTNAAKYALDNTRVYVDVTADGNEWRISVKNVSREPLNIRPEDLMERFVRGDESRQTEGSGLGLSIARSLMELQGGRLAIHIDGDLFKVFLFVQQTPADAGSAPEPTPTV